MLFLFSASAFLSAFLLFLVQPMFAKMVLPLLGGSPAVWTTCMLFFQTVLFAGYLYVHRSIAVLGVRRQVVLHIFVAVLPILLLPIRIPSDSRPPAEGFPIAWLVTLMVFSVGAPFFVLSTTAPLLQRWFSTVRHRSAADPYFLYAASNAGSLSALLVYPVAIEPFLSLPAQQLSWAAGYMVITILVVACSFKTDKSAELSDQNSSGTAGPPLSTARRLGWLALAFVPSGLMLAVTAQISTDVAAVPLLWIAPLALYLSTFIVAFSNRAPPFAAVAQRILPMILLLLVLFLVGQVGAELWFIIPLHLITFWLMALLCHWRLSSDRPPPSQLTEFYLWLAAGGMLGGMFNLAAPLLFVSVAEYPILIALGCFLLASYSEIRASIREARLLIRPLAVGVLAAVILFAGVRLDIEPGVLLPLLSVPALLCFSLSRDPARFAMAVSMLLLSGLVSTARGYGDILYAERTFFGVYRVTVDAGNNFVTLFHGTTVHGRQATQNAANPEPLTYYHHDSPIADVLTWANTRRVESIGIVGLGVGSLAAYAQVGQRWTFYEIDPAIHRIAQDDRYFTFLRKCGQACEVILGDGRLAIDASSQKYDVLVLDAFTSDAIPVHLLTTEAVRTYLLHLSEAGVLVFHISNRHFDLGPVLSRVAADQQLIAITKSDYPDTNIASGRTASRWMAMSRSAESVNGLIGEQGWSTAPPSTARAWTDNFTNVWSVLQLR